MYIANTLFFLDRDSAQSLFQSFLPFISASKITIVDIYGRDAINSVADTFIFSLAGYSNMWKMAFIVEDKVFVLF